MGPARGARLKTTLETAAGKQSPVFIVGHYPLFLKQPDEKEAYANLPPERRKQLLALFEQHGVVAMLTGHTHKVIVNDHHGIQLVTGPTTSKTHGSPLGFLLWHVKGARPFKHEAIVLKNDPHATKR